MPEKITTWNDAHLAVIELLKFVNDKLTVESRKTIDQAPFYGYEIGHIERQLRKAEHGIRVEWMREQREAGK